MAKAQIQNLEFHYYYTVTTTNTTTTNNNNNTTSTTTTNNNDTGLWLSQNPHVEGWNSQVRRGIPPEI